MSKFVRTALAAVFSLGIAATLGGTGTATAFGAALVPGEESGVLLPQSVREAAQDEAESASDYTIIPEAAEEAAPSRAESLAAMVAERASTEIANREEECLAAAIYFEARSEPLEGQLAVAQVILNRASSGRFPASLCGVVFQPSQFSFVRGSAFPPIARTSQDWREAVAVARIAREGAWNSRAANALYFHASRVSPGWRLSRVAAIGNHVFYH